MSAPARLLAVRLQGFKSFALRTVVEFGPGISAVVGPNGAGKSNLADALRWAFGEQGRALRSRRSEDVIFAGSERRPAVGMADVAVAIDNADGLLPTGYSVVELGRRLFRSGENEYLLNGTRVRLRDLEELLDAAHLAENAFLFIGQGMVDQALALRPEERRPLFEEVAGVRRHDRRKRAAEQQLLEAEANVVRIRDLIAELRPQARRLAGQAKQQSERVAAAAALADAVVAVGRAAWHEASGRLAGARRQHARARAALDAAIAALRAADDAALELDRSTDERAARARAARAVLDGVRAELEAARIAEAGTSAEAVALEREAARLAGERSTLEAEMAEARRRLALPAPRPPEEAEGVEPAAALSDAGNAGSLAERLAERRRALAEEDAAAERSLRAEDGARLALDVASGNLAQASALASAALAEVEAQRRVVAELAGRHAAAEEQARAARAEADRLGDRLVAVAERLRLSDHGSPPAGGEPLATRISVDPELQGAVEAALGSAAGATVVATADVDPGTRSVTLVLRDAPIPALPAGEGVDARAAAAREGGGPLAGALRDDPTGVGERLLRRALWVPDLPAALRVAARLPPGWSVSTLAGDRLDARAVLDPAAETSRLALAEESARLAASHAEREAAAAVLAAASASIETELRAARDALTARHQEASEREAERRARAREEGAAARAHELAVREAAWARAQRQRLQAELERLERQAGEGAATRGDARQHVAAWDAYRTALRERQRLEGRLAGDEARLEALAVAEGRLDEARTAVAAESEQLTVVLATLAARSEAEAAAAVAIERDEAAARLSHESAERTRRAARDALAAAESETRDAEMAELEARLALDGVRERLLVELAALGRAGWRALDGPSPEGPSTGEEPDGEQLERALDTVAEGWATSPLLEVPPPARLAALRRRYHELGAVNPFAVEEHEEVSRRLAELEGQRDDLERAIAATRRLIAELEQLIAERFQSTFEALEAAFGRRFAQLFDGGRARLVLTDPEDPAASGVEIVAQPPGKKSQPLAMLSGGERALTAVALLFAMLEVRPVPFCVLDEVDAALDEANIGRFAAALRELARTIQFVVITHNRGTIEEADALYGVTIGDDAVSRVISLRLDPVPGNGRATAARVDEELAAGRGRPSGERSS